jgi:hypothetical protein
MPPCPDAQCRIGDCPFYCDSVRELEIKIISLFSFPRGSKGSRNYHTTRVQNENAEKKKHETGHCLVNGLRWSAAQSRYNSWYLIFSADRTKQKWGTDELTKRRFSVEQQLLTAQASVSHSSHRIQSLCCTTSLCKAKPLSKLEKHLAIFNHWASTGCCAGWNIGNSRTSCKLFLSTCTSHGRYFLNVPPQCRLSLCKLPQCPALSTCPHLNANNCGGLPITGGFAGENLPWARFELEELFRAWRISRSSTN